MIHEGCGQRTSQHRERSATVSDVQPSRRRRLAWALWALGLVCAFAVGFLWWVGVFGGNVRTVEDGSMYRSAQLTGPNLTHVLQSYRIRSVINLRGALPHDASYRSELATCTAAAVPHRDVRLSATRLPPPEQLQELLADLDTMPRPILIHCQGGADRSGLAAALYLAIYRGVPLDQAEAGQLTWRYGHLWFGKASAMDEFFALYRQTGNGLSLRQWIGVTYPRVYAGRTAAGIARAGRRSGGSGSEAGRRTQRGLSSALRVR